MKRSIAPLALCGLLVAAAPAPAQPAPRADWVSEEVHSGAQVTVLMADSKVYRGTFGSVRDGAVQLSLPPAAAGEAEGSLSLPFSNVSRIEWRRPGHVKLGWRICGLLGGLIGGTAAAVAAGGGIMGYHHKDHTGEWLAFFGGIIAGVATPVALSYAFPPSGKVECGTAGTPVTAEAPGVEDAGVSGAATGDR
jgi:hypothetical protein